MSDKVVLEEALARCEKLAADVEDLMAWSAEQKVKNKNNDGFFWIKFDCRFFLDKLRSDVIRGLKKAQEKEEEKDGTTL
jgi:hypothetical protein